MRLVKTGKQYWLKAKFTDEDMTPKARRVSKSDVDYLLSLSTEQRPGCGTPPASTFEMAAIMDFGVGVFRRQP
jgi:hypothetical protein